MENTKNKILILYASVGLGHKSIAENIGYYLTEAGYEVRLEDAQKVQGGILASWGKSIYQWMVPRLPFIWDFLYNTEWFINSTLFLRTMVASRNYKNILETIIEFQPDVVISTHTTASAIMSYLKKEGYFSKTFGIAFSDFHLHKYWLYDNADFYLANTPEQKEEMVELGTYRNKIFVCGITLKPKAEVDIKKVLEKYEIKKGEKVVLVSSGSQGFGVDENLISKVLKRENTKVIVLCGNNQKGFEHLEKKFKYSDATILGYHQEMDELYAIADIFVTKAGALSVSEALLWRVPILVSHLLPGQEIHNYDYLLEKGLIMPEPINIVDSIFEELETESFKKSILNNPNLEALFNQKDQIIEAVKQLNNASQKFDEERVFRII